MVTILDCQSMKQKGEKITMLTVYDASFAQLCSTAGVEILLVGDSLGTVMQGEASTVPVALDHVVYHLRCAARGNQGALLMGDMPFMTYYQADVALASAKQLMQAGAAMVKLEGGAWLVPTIKQLTACGIPVCAHLGLTPQSVHMLGGNKVQGRDAQQAEAMLQDALALQEAGASLLVLECVPACLAADITQALTIPTIGIGAGAACDGQVLVCYDMLSITPGRTFKFAKNYLAEHADIASAVAAYVREVKEGVFPGVEHSFV